LRKRVEAKWDGLSIPDIGAKVRLWLPAWRRGEKATVVATEMKAKKGYRVSPVGKVRVEIADCAWSVGFDEILPMNVKPSEIYEE
jgi:hypothetical protein